MYLRILVSNTLSVSHDVHACLAVTLLVSLVEHELLTPPDHIVHPQFLFTSVVAMLYQRKQKYGTGTAFHSRTPGVLGINVP